MQSHINELEDNADVLSRLQRPIDDAEKYLQMLDAKLLLEADTRKTGTDSSKIVRASVAAAKLNEALGVANTTNVGTNGFEQRSKQRPWNNRQRHSHPYQQRSSKSSVCYYCREKCHLRRECPMKQRHDGKRGETDTNKTASANVAEATREVKWGAVAIIPKVTGTILNVDQRGKATLQNQYWVLDSGATHHMTSEKSYFRTIEEMDTNVQLGDDSAVKVCGVGTAEVILQDENGGFVTLELTNCYFVPALANNLLSVQKLRKKGIRSDLETYEDRATLKKDGITVWSVVDPNVDLNVFEHNQKNTSEVHAYVGVGHNTIELWHSRLGHLGYQNIARWVKQRSTTGIQISDRQLSDFSVCDECTRANQQRASFKNTNTDHAKQVNGLVFTDLKGAIEVDSFGRKRYVYLIVDDRSIYITAYLLRLKSEALQKFQEYVEQAENKQGRGIIGVNSDNEGEFISPAWIAYCNKKGIARRTTTPRTPEQNGSAEVRLRVLFRKVRSMLIAAQLPKQFWGEAVHAAVYVANRSPLHRSEVTPFERWHGTAPDYSLLQVFGSIAYTYVTETHAKSLQATATPGKRKTLDNRSLRGIFVGYADTQKAWRVLLCGTGEILSTCHATFDESNSYSTMELRQLELARLGRRLSLEYIQPSCIAASVPDLVFYAEPISDNDDRSSTPDELHHLDVFFPGNLTFMDSSKI